MITLARSNLGPGNRWSLGILRRTLRSDRDWGTVRGECEIKKNREGQMIRKIVNTEKSGNISDKHRMVWICQNMIRPQLCQIVIPVIGVINCKITVHANQIGTMYESRKNRVTETGMIEVNIEVATDKQSKEVH